jgi:two-component system, sensor histidine kinase ChiS
MSDRILVVDDNEDVAHITASFLTAKGYTVVVAHDGTRALEVIAEAPPACVLLDVMMPNMSGIEVLNRLKENPSTSSIPVILVTAKSRDEDVLSGYKEGADYYITKPFSAQQLLYGVRLVLGLGGSAPPRTIDPTSTSHH